MAKFKKKYDKAGYWHEMLDRTHCLNVMLEEMLVNHPLANHPALKAHIEEAGRVMGALYQHIGGVMDGRFPTEPQ